VSCTRKAYGNIPAFFNKGVISVRTRWVDYKDKEFDPSQIEPGWYVKQNRISKLMAMDSTDF
jgi:hypothetical protein